MRRNRHKRYRIDISRDSIDNEILIHISKNGSFYDEVIFHARDDRLEFEKYLLKTIFRIARDLYNVRE